MNALSLNQRFEALDVLLAEHQWLWREQPFKIVRPGWVSRMPRLAQRALLLDDHEVEALLSDNRALIEWMAQEVPQLRALPALLQVPESTAVALMPSRLDWEVPGRKWQQIGCFAASVGEPQAMFTEWCAGKGHLGRLLASRFSAPVESVEIDPALCHAGTALARRGRVSQQFVRADVLRDDVSMRLAGRHVLALHACGSLHRSLVSSARSHNIRALDVAPCCYYRGEDSAPASSRLALTRDDLRLAVTETATAGRREIRQRDQAHAWRLGYVALRAAVQGDETYRDIKPIRATWLQEGFESFCRRLAERDALTLPAGLPWKQFEDAGWMRHREVMRLSAPRFAFRRALEVWLVCRLGIELQQQGYDAGIESFCPQTLTPRNLRVHGR